tara:strand:+ start:297 stop:563 length:267 start_codon:yes stop_codon:yes gene_type:complete
MMTKKRPITNQSDDRITLSTTLDMSGGYRIKFHQNTWWVVGHGNATDCGPTYTTAKRVLEGMTEYITVYTPEMRKLDLDAFGKGLADV